MYKIQALNVSLVLCKSAIAMLFFLCKRAHARFYNLCIMSGTVPSCVSKLRPPTFYPEILDHPISCFGSSQAVFPS